MNIVKKIKKLFCKHDWRMIAYIDYIYPRIMVYSCRKCRKMKAERI